MTTTPRVGPQGIHLKFLKTKCPDSTEAECVRFLAAYPPKSHHRGPERAARKLQDYLDWRLRFYNTLESMTTEREHTDDEIHWKDAADAARLHGDTQPASLGRRSSRRRRSSDTNRPAKGISQIVLQHTNDDGSPVRCQSDHMLLQVVPARVDTEVASIDEYTHMLSLYLEHKFDRHSMEQSTLLLDVRAGDGWANPKGYTMIPFIRAVTKVLHQRFPGRLHRCIVYPLPPALLWIWEMAKPFLNSEIVASTTLVAGPCAAESAPPNEALSKFVSEPLLERLEGARLAAFETSPRKRNGRA